MNITRLSDIYQFLKTRNNKHLVVANGIDNHSIEAAHKALEMNIVNVTLIGDSIQIKNVCDELKIDDNLFQVIHEADEIEATSKAVTMGRNGEADIIMKGMVSTDQFMRAILNKEKGILPPNTLLSHTALIESKKYHKLLIFGDVAVVPAPTKEQKLQITQYLIDAAKSIGLSLPKVALIAATEKVIKSMPACTDAVFVKEWFLENNPDAAIIEGPMGLDIALSKKAAEIKGFESPVSGDVDCLLFPNIESGNVFYKTNTNLGEVSTAAILTGTKIPTVLSSRGDSMETKLNSIAFAALKG